MTKTSLVVTLILGFSLAVSFSCSKKTETEARVSVPVFNPQEGIYSTLISVEIFCKTEGAVIYYTLDGTEPQEESLQYQGPMEITETVLIKARAYKAGMTESEIASAVYTIEYPIPDNMVYVEGGTFNPAADYSVTVTAFYIGMYEVTQLEYQTIAGDNPAFFSDNLQRPVETVSWFDAVEYCNRRSLAEGLTPCYSFSDYGSDPENWPNDWNSHIGNHIHFFCDWTANGYRLPTEMEWMFAALGGIESEGYLYSGSDNADDVAWYDGNSGGSTQPVGSKVPNELGLYDMSGNVWEWTWDIWDEYPFGIFTDPKGADEGTNRVRRGGSWNYVAIGCTVHERGNSVATWRFRSVGFRIARNAH